jgi:NADP-dependent 3-hydroxy acid dehydrogenase YdfG
MKAVLMTGCSSGFGLETASAANDPSSRFALLLALTPWH